MSITAHLSSCPYRIHGATSVAICGTHYRSTLGTTEIPYPCRDDSLFRASRIFSRMRSDVLQASRSSRIALVERVCQHRWIRSHLHSTSLDVGPNVCSHLPLGFRVKPVGLGLTQCSIRHTRLALTIQRIGDFLLHGCPRMLWSPSSFEGWGKRGVHRTVHQF